MKCQSGTQLLGMEDNNHKQHGQRSSPLAAAAVAAVAAAVAFSSVIG